MRTHKTGTGTQEDPIRAFIPEWLENAGISYSTEYREQTDDYDIHLNLPEWATISRMQFNVQLRKLGLKETVYSAIQSIAEGNDDAAILAQEWLEFGTTVQRFSPMVISLGQNFEVDLDVFFQQASEITA